MIYDLKCSETVILQLLASAIRVMYVVISPPGGAGKTATATATGTDRRLSLVGLVWSSTDPQPLSLISASSGLVAGLVVTLPIMFIVVGVVS